MSTEPYLSINGNRYKEIGMKKTRMSDKDIQYIVENSTKKTAAEIAKTLGRTEKAIQAIGDKIGITFKGK